jgi:hypothetical protein
MQRRESAMSLELQNTKLFDVVGSGYVPEQHADVKRRYLTTEKKAVGGAIAWLTFYVIAIVTAVVANYEKVAGFVVAATH